MEAEGGVGMGGELPALGAFEVGEEGEAALVIGGIGRLLSQGALGPGTEQQQIGAFIELSSPLLLAWLWFVTRQARN